MNFYKFTLGIERDSGIVDNIPVIISYKLIGQNLKINDYIHIKGVYKSYKKCGKLKLYVSVNELNILTYTDNINDVFLEGVITQPPTLRFTPNGRKISDILLPEENIEFGLYDMNDNLINVYDNNLFSLNGEKFIITNGSFIFLKDYSYSISSGDLPWI